jgi:putative transposase
MARPYSLDLRERVVAAVVRAGLSRRRAAAQFGIGIRTAIRWVDQFRRTGSLAPGKMGGHKPKAIAGAHRAWLLQRITEGDFTLRGLVAELGERGLKVDYRSVWNFVHSEKLSFKKNRDRERARSSGRGAAARAVDQISGPRRA